MIKRKLQCQPSHNIDNSIISNVNTIGETPPGNFINSPTPGSGTDRLLQPATPEDDNTL